jgi:hypothetical protein
VECHTSNVPSVALKDEQRCWIGRADVEELHCMVSSGGEVSFIRRDT